MDEDPLFASTEGEVVMKSAAAGTIRAIVQRAGQDPSGADGHSMRRTGAQMLVAAGVDPKMVEWFGRWRFESVRAYTEDARAQAPQAAQIASLVMHPASPTPAHVTAGQAPRTRAGGGFGAPRTPAPYAQGVAPHEPAAQADFINLKRWVENKLAVADRETPCYPLRIASSKMHIRFRLCCALCVANCTVYTV